MQQTTNYGLKKPEANEYYNVGDFNYNADTIDAALKDLEDGKANLDEGGKVPSDQIPEMDYVPNSEKGQPGGVATLGDDGKVPEEQLPIAEITVDDALSETSTNPVQNKVVASALKTKASLDENGKVPSSQLPDHSALNTSYDDTNTALGADNVQEAVEKVKEELDTKASGTHDHPASEVKAGTFAGQVKANASAVSTIGTAQVRNIYAGTADMTAGTTALATGEIYLVYE